MYLIKNVGKLIHKKLQINKPNVGWKLESVRPLELCIDVVLSFSIVGLNIFSDLM